MRVGTDGEQPGKPTKGAPIGVFPECTREAVPSVELCENPL